MLKLHKSTKEISQVMSTNIQKDIYGAESELNFFDDDKRIGIGQRRLCVIAMAESIVRKG